MPEPLVENISDTARWVATYRAMETARSDAHFRDPYARDLAGERGEQILRAMPGGRSSAWAFVVRTCLFDELLTKAVRELPADMVVNLAAGLDARPYRMDLPKDLTWVEVDLPAILAHKREKLAAVRPVCRLESVALDLSNVPARRELFAGLARRVSRIVVVTEGLLVYLSREEVGALAADLRANAPFRRWILDLGSPELLKWLQRRYQKTLGAAGAPLKFGPEEGVGFFRPFGWTEGEYRSVFEEAKRLRREMRLAWIFRILFALSSRERREKARRFSGAVVLEPA